MIRPVLILPLLLSAGCDSTGSADGSPEAAAKPGVVAPQAAGTRVTLALLPPNAAGATAAASGRLAIRGRCLVLEAAGAVTNLAFATAATKWDESAGELRVGDRSFAPGSRVALGGGAFAGDSSALRWLRAPASECREGLWIVASIDPVR